MLVQELNLKNLLTLPACCQHLTLLPVVNVDGIGVEILVISPTEIAHVLILVKFFAIFVSVTVHKVLLLLAFILSVNFRCSSSFYLLSFYDWVD